MSWITIVWSMASAVCATLALIHLAIWFGRRSQVVHLLFALTALGAAGNALAELGMLKATTVEGYATALRMSFVPLVLLVISMAWYVRSYFGTGRRYLAAAITVVWALVLIIDAFSPFSPVFSQISGLRITPTPWGEPFALAKGVISPLNPVISVADLIFLVFVVDASAAFWRRGERRRAVFFGVGIVGGSLVAVIVARMIDFGVLQMPYVTTFVYIGIVVVFGYPLSLDVVRTAQLARQLQESEAELRESEGRFRVVADSAPVLIWMSGTDKLCNFFNKGWLDFTGRRLEEELGNGWAEGVHAEDFDRCLEVYVTSFDARQQFTMEYRLRRNDGEYRWVLDSGTPRFASDGAFLGYIGSCIDITERKLAEEKFRLVLDAAPNAMIMVDSAGVISFANAPAATVFGYSLSELIGRPIETLIPERFHDRHAGYRKGFLSEPSNRAMGAGRDLFGRRKDGSEFPVEVGLNPIRTTEGLFVLASVIDITARKQAELEHQRQNMELARVGRVAVMGELAASLAHEVNNPLAAIVTNASAGQRLIAAGKIETEELNELLGDIVADGRRAGEVIQGVRNMVRKGKARRALIQIGDIIRELLRIVNADAIEREVKVTAEVDSDAGPVWGDRVQLLQVLLNLTLNAFEAMLAMRPDARRLVVHTGRNENGEIVVSVRDTGPGFTGGSVEQLFEPFFSTKAEGTGMGLAIARSIVEAHGGVLSGENCDDGGACFTVRLPEAQEDKPRAA
jgi:PAS domain S-box-containing protein